MATSRPHIRPADTEVNPMKQYLLSVYQPADTTPPPEVLGPIMDKVGKWRNELEAAGAWVFTGALAPASTATVLRVADGETILTDGPFTEGKEHLGGITGLPLEVRPLHDSVEA